MKCKHKWVLATAMLAVVAAIHTTPVAAQSCPEMEGRWPYGPAAALEMSGNTAYVAMGSVLKIIDITNVAAPVELGAIVVPGAINGLAVSGSQAFVTTAEAGLTIVDISTPSAPTEVASQYVGIATDVALSGSYAYVTSLGDLLILDISTYYPYPEPVGFFEIPTGTPEAIAVSGGHAFVAMNYHGTPQADVIVVDISDPFNPMQAGSFSTSASHTVGIAIAGSHAHVVDETGLRVLDISDPGSPVELGTYSPSSGTPKAVAADGSYAYLASERPGYGYSYGHIDVVDVSTPSTPVLTAELDAPASINAISASGHQIFMAADSAGLRIVDWFQGTDLSFVDAPGKSWDVAVDGTIAYLVDAEGMRVVDVSTAATPIELGSHEGGGGSIEVAGGYAFVADCSNGLRVYDVGDPTAPTQVGQYDSPSCAVDVAVMGNHAYLSDSSSLRVVDVGTPSAPVEVGSVTMNTIGVTVAGSRAYVATGSELRIVDISDPVNPAELGGLTIAGVPWSVAVSGSTAFVAARHGLHVIDVGDPADPTEIASLTEVSGLSVSPVNVVLSGNLAYMTDESSFFSGMSVVDVSVPTAPEEVGYARMPGTAAGLATNGSHVFVASSAAGMAVFSQCAVATKGIFSDGFESGDTAAWSSATR